MYFKAHFEKEWTCRLHEDRIGSCVFCAQNYECARQIVTTVSMRINRQHYRMSEPCGVHVSGLQGMDEGRHMYSKVAIAHCVPLVGFLKIRRALEMFYPRELGSKRRVPLLSSFDHWKPLPHPSTKKS
jgi:hypothetical protein